MKISKLNITDFRWFRGHNTFDFLDDQKIPARVIVIYAPNGSGKTSLTEAIEWAFRGKIERLDVLLSEYKGSKPREGHILKNRNSAAVSGTVSIELTGATDNVTLSRSTSPLGNRRNNDYLLTAAEIVPANGLQLSSINVNQYILSQTKINEFLLNASVGKLFQGFLSLGGRETDLAFYNQLRDRKKDLISKLDNVKAQQKDINSAVSNSKKQRAALQKEIDGDLRVQELLFFNEINILVDQDFFTPSENSGADRLRSANVRLQWIHDNLSNLKAALDDVLAARAERITLTQAKKRREHGRLRVRRIQLLNKRLGELMSTENILRDFEEVSRLPAVVSALGQLRNLEANVGIIKNKQARLALLVDKRKDCLSTAQREFERKSTHIRGIETWCIESKILFEEHGVNPFDLQKTRSECIDLENTINYKMLTASAVKSGKLEAFSQESLTKYQLSTVVAEISELTVKLEAEQATLLNLRATLSTLESNSQALSDFKQRAIELAQKDNSCNCPACGTNFSDNALLIETIAKANLNLPAELRIALDIAEQSRSQSLAKLEEKKHVLESKLKDLTAVLDEEIIQQKDLLQEKRAQLKSAERLVSEMAILNLNELRFEASSEVYANVLKSILPLKLELDQLKDIVQRIQGQLARLAKIAQGQSSMLNDANHGVNAGRLVLHLSEYEAKAERVSRQLAVDVAQIPAKLVELKDFIASTKEELEHETNELFEETELVSLEQVDQLFALEEQELDRLIFLDNERSKVKRYLRNLQSKVPSAKLRALQQTQTRIQSAIVECTRLLNMNESHVVLESHILSEKQLSEQAELLRIQFDAYTNQVRSIDLAIKSAQEFLIDIIKKTTNIELLNDIYRLIDPNLSYRKIAFEVDITKGKESLFIKSAEHVTHSATFNDDLEKDGPAQISPALFFSEAQSNVLSICLFLTNIARATKDNLDFLLMDDPVQSMDDINAYAFVDMCRLFAEKFDKQLIITTHDAGFYHLFQQRFPAESSKFRYIELSESCTSY